MNPYNNSYHYGPTYMGQSQPATVPHGQYQTSFRNSYQGPPPPPVAPKPAEHARLAAVRHRINNIQNVTQTVWPSVIGCAVIQAVAAFFYIVSALTFVLVLPNALDFSDDATDDGYVLYIVFFVFVAVASAMCAPMILNSGYTTVMLGGCVLMLFSTMTSSLTTSAEVLVIPFGIFGGCAYGMLRTAPQVAMLDYLNDRRALATGLSYLGVTVGTVAGSLSFGLTDMDDDARYDDDGPARWPNNMRIIEVTVVAALMSVAVLRKPSFQTGNWPSLFRYSPFYILCVVYFFFNFGLSILTSFYGNVPEDRDFRTHISGSNIMTPTFIGQLVGIVSTVVILIFSRCCCMDSFRKAGLMVTAVFVAILSAASFINDLTYDEFWIFCIFTSFVGFVESLVRITVPLAMITYTGRANYKIAVPFLEVFGGLGSLAGTIANIEMDIPDDISIETGWYVCAGMFVAVAAFAMWAACSGVAWVDQLADGREHHAREVEAIENAAFDENAEDVIASLGDDIFDPNN